MYKEGTIMISGLIDKSYEEILKILNSTTLDIRKSAEISN
jgi:hypothetical protein